MTGIEMIAAERQEQITKHGFDLADDNNNYKNNELVNAAIYSLTLKASYYPKTWTSWWRKRMFAKKDRMSYEQFEIEKLKIAGALIAAQIDKKMDEAILNKLVNNSSKS